jgi:hypothetical protein
VDQPNTSDKFLWWVAGAPKGDEVNVETSA